MICGAAKKKITPGPGLLKNLNGLGNLQFSDVLDDIYVRVLLLGDDKQDRILFVVFDLDKVPYPEKYLPALSELTGIPETHITLASIHTHTAPIAGWRPTEGPNFILNKPEHVQNATHQYEAFLEQVVREAVAEAMACVQPVRIGWSHGESFVNINRLQDYFVRKDDGTVEVRVGLGQNPSVPVDRSLFVLKIEDMQGRPVACLTNYAVHNCVMIGNHCGEHGGTLLSSDLGGNVSQMIEENYPGCVALWTSGAAGDVNPILSNEIFYPDPKTGKQTAYVLPAGEQAPCMMLKVLSARHYADILTVLEHITCTDTNMSLGSMVSWAYTPGKDSPYEIRVHLTRIGDLAFWGVSGELYSSIGRAIVQAMPNGIHHIINHDASLMANTGYIFDDQTLMRDPDGTLPGRRNNGILPGFAEKALLELTSGMWQHTCQKSEENYELSDQAEIE